MPSQSISRPFKDLTRDLVDSGNTLRQDGVRVDALEEKVTRAEAVESHLRHENVVKVVLQPLLKHFHSLEQPLLICGTMLVGERRGAGGA